MNFGCVLPNLFVGSSPVDDDDFRQLKALNITAILSLQTQDDDRAGAIENERVTAGAIGMGFVNLGVTDFDRLELVQKLPDCVKAVEKLIAGGDSVYLHCTAGVNRSPTVAAAYLHWCLQWPLEQALEHIQDCRNCCPDEDVIQRATDLRNRDTP